MAANTNSGFIIEFILEQLLLNFKKKIPLLRLKENFHIEWGLKFDRYNAPNYFSLNYHKR